MEEVKQVTPEQAVVKAHWICECGRKTEQLQGRDVKLVTHCACGKALYKLLEPDGVTTEFVDAPDWFKKEFMDHDKHMNELDRSFRQASWQRVKCERLVVDIAQRIENGQQKMRNIIDSGAQRMKLLKRKDMHWEYNPGMGKFVGWPKGSRGSK